MLLYKSQIFRIALAAFFVASCNETHFKSTEIPSQGGADVVTEPPIEIPPPADPAPVVPDPGAPDPAGPLTETTVLEEVFTQEGLPGTADIAIVVDNSKSMANEQENLSSKLDDLLGSLKNSDWQIGVVSSTVKRENGKDVCQLKLIKAGDSDIEQKFKDAVSQGVTGSGSEQGIRQAVNALKCPETPWVRPDSTIAVLIVSDEDNCSNDGFDCPREPWAKEDYLISYVEKDLKRTVGKNAGFYGIIAPENEDCPTAVNVGIQYERLFRYKTSDASNFGNICDPSYRQTLERISQNIAKLLTSNFVLKQIPDLASTSIMGVKANGDPITAEDYTVEGSKIAFKIGSEPALGSQIVASYKVTRVIAP